MRTKTVVGLMAAVMLVGFSASQANAQLRHGISIQKGCDGLFCVGDTTNCSFLVSYGDDYGDSTMLMEAYDKLDTDGDGTFETRVPASGNLPIMEVGGNTTCTVGGSLPCNLGPADIGAGLEPGFVIFQQNQYVIGPNDVSPLQDQAHVIWKDLCDAPGTSNCSSAVNDANAPASTPFPICNDDDACTNDSCDGGECLFESVCLDPNYDCDDSNVCTDDVCDDTMDGCCAHNPIPCGERACYNNTGCDPTDGCQYESVCTDPTYCDDSNVCTSDSCDEGVDGCCNHEDIPCAPRACYNNTGCDPTDGCQYESVCTDPTYCDDSNVCTADTCDEGADGCCNHEDIPCPERTCYNITGCDPTDGCQYESVCADPNYDCDDSNVCTIDTCDATAGGCCTHEPVVCEERPCYVVVGCDPVEGCQYESVCADLNYDCDDSNVCTADSCDESADGCCTHEDIPCAPRACYNNTGCDPTDGCQYESVCADPNYDCDDSNVCTIDTCDATAGGCCTHEPVVCEERPCYVVVGCDPVEGCQYESVCADLNYDCDDSNVCTADSCDESADGCCTHEDIPCAPRACYNNTGCDPTDGCQYESVCTDPTYCDDHNVCTTDSCDEGADGCCTHEDVPCEPRPCYNLVGCDPVNGCQYEPVTCDDQDPCTEDTCDAATGACVFTDIIPAPPECVTYAGCTPGFWKQRQHFVYWVGYAPSDLWEDVFGVDAVILHGKTLLEAAGTGGGGEAALGRHAVAALLNSTNDDVAYYYSTDAVIALVQEAYATGNFNSIKNMLAAQNELGCTVNTSGQKDPDSGHGWQNGR